MNTRAPNWWRIKYNVYEVGILFRGGGGGLSGVDKFTLKSVKIDIL